MANLPASPFLISRVTRSLNIACIIFISLFAVTLLRASTISSADGDCPSNPGQGCSTQAKIDLVFIIDSSESVQELGQTYNVQLEGIIRALDNPTIIPRDKSVAVAVITFNLSPNVVVPLTEVNSAAAADIIAAIKKLKCPEEGICATQGPLKNTNYNAAIRAADVELNRSERKPARRIMLLSSDGDPNIPDFGVTESMNARQSAKNDGMPLELDAILVGIASSSSNFTQNKKNLSDITFRVPENAGEPLTLVLNVGDCNNPGASFGVNCSGQADEFAERTREILGDDITTANLIVNTDADTTPNTTAADSVVSLREAIERANSRGGKTIITFHENVKGKTISLLTPLPALTAPDITIDGIGECVQDKCPPPVTLDGSRVEVAGGEAHSDGILIRSNHDTVRGLKIVNFKRAGIAIAPVCPCDIAGCNRIELNILANNAKAGVLVLDPPQSQGTIISHNVGNIISRNAVSGSAIPIDLGGDGATANDDRSDPDSGPNTLLNFPLIDSALQTASGVSLKGKAASKQVIEIFKVTKNRTESGNPVIDAVEFVKEVTADMDGVFELSVSDAGFYTATATDPFISVFSCRNTSELTPIVVSCTAPAIAKITLEGNKDALEFEPEIASSEARTDGPSRTFTVENTGCAPLEVRSLSIQREVSNQVGRKITDKDDSLFFSVRIINQDGMSSEFPKSLLILPGSKNARKFMVVFHPIIPPVTGLKEGLSAKQVLPSKFKSILMLTHNGEGQRTVALMGKVDTAAQLINSNMELPRRPPLVTLTRSGDKLIVIFYVYDSDLSNNKVEYLFFDDKGTPIKPENSNNNIHPKGRVLRGQSYKVTEDFSGATGKSIVSVRVTLSDRNKVESVSSKLTESQR